MRYTNESFSKEKHQYKRNNRRIKRGNIQTIKSEHRYIRKKKKETVRGRWVRSRQIIYLFIYFLRCYWRINIAAACVYIIRHLNCFHFYWKGKNKLMGDFKMIRSVFRLLFLLFSFLCYDFLFELISDYLSSNFSWCNFTFFLFIHCIHL